MPHNLLLYSLMKKTIVFIKIYSFKVCDKNISLTLQVGSACAYHHVGSFFGKRYFVLLVASVLVITWLNLR